MSTAPNPSVDAAQAAAPEKRRRHRAITVEITDDLHAIARVKGVTPEAVVKAILAREVPAILAKINAALDLA